MVMRRKKKQIINLVNKYKELHILNLEWFFSNLVNQYFLINTSQQKQIKTIVIIK